MVEITSQVPSLDSPFAIFIDPCTCDFMMLFFDLISSY